MDQNKERETHDFMSIESFSQLPFLRPSKEKAGIRLFGIEFGGGGGGGGATNDHSDDQNNGGGGGEGEVSNKELSNGDTSSRRFECHYCWRNFPTSQALGGHQNAHKRERQNAKRAHLQSLMVHGGTSMDAAAAAAAAHDYGVMSYGRTLPPPYQSWRPYGSHAIYNAPHHHQQQQPQPIISGSPLGLWRIPAAPAPTPFAQERIHRQINPLKQPLSTSTHQGSSSQLANESKPAMHDHLSLDLHL